MLIVNMATSYPVTVYICTCDSLLYYRQHGWSQPLSDLYICMCWLLMIHVQLRTHLAVCIQVNSTGTSWACLFECVCVFEQIQDTLSKRSQADGVDAYLQQTDCTGCLQFTQRTHACTFSQTDGKHKLWRNVHHTMNHWVGHSDREWRREVYRGE